MGLTHERAASFGVHQVIGTNQLERDGCTTVAELSTKNDPYTTCADPFDDVELVVQLWHQVGEVAGVDGHDGDALSAGGARSGQQVTVIALEGAQADARWPEGAREIEEAASVLNTRWAVSKGPPRQFDALRHTVVQQLDGCGFE